MLKDRVKPCFDNRKSVTFAYWFCCKWILVYSIIENLAL